MGRSPFAESVTQQVQKSAARFPWQNESRVSTIRAMGMDLECGRYSRAYGGSDCGWVDYVQWSGSYPAGIWDTISYTYDAAGRRVTKAVDGQTTTKYVYDGDHCLAEYDGNNNLLRKYIYGPAVDEPISMIDVEHSNATYYYHFDGLGSVTALTNASGTTAVLYEYSVYGQVAASDPNHPNRFLFTGREFDKETGLYYYRARYYNPEIGRFLQTDPTGYGDGMNWYAYCRNNSTNCVDPSGMVGRFLDSDSGLLRYEAENGEISEFTDLEQWMDWFALDVESHGYAVSKLAGYGMAGGDTNLNKRVLWIIQAMIALGYDEDKVRACDAGGVTIDYNADNVFKEEEMEEQVGTEKVKKKIIRWDPSGASWGQKEIADYGVVTPPHWETSFPAWALLAHEIEHGWQDVRGELKDWDTNVRVREVSEGKAMMAENAMAYAFYKKVPGYRKGELHETKGPVTYYWPNGISRVTNQPYEARKDMTWDDYTPCFTPLY